MAKKMSEKAVGIVIAIVGIALVAVAIYLTSSLGGGSGGHEEPASSDILGPETVDAGTTTGQQTALNDPNALPQQAGPSMPTPPVEFKSDYLTFHASFPDAAPGDPVIAYLREDAEGYLRRMKGDAEKETKRPQARGAPKLPWDVDIKWTYTAKAGGLVSLAGTADEFTGGAHPTTLFDTHIARVSGEAVKFNDMLKADKTPSPAAQVGICEALKAAKTERINSATIFDEPITCVGPSANAKTEEAEIALAPSSEAGKFGGLIAYYGPYTVGPHVEGPYEVTVQQAVFAEDLKPEFRALFAGQAPQADR